MKKILILLLFVAPWVWAHDHIEVGEDPSDPSRLGLDGPGFQLSLYVPPGEPFSGYLPQFPGDWHASELTFTTDANALDPAPGADPSIELISINGPAGATFAFWEVGATSPTWTVHTGWTNAPGDTRSFPVILFGDSHVHGRAFTMDLPGEYTAVFQAVDQANNFTPSANKPVTFSALLPPPLSIRIENGNAELSFTSRLNLDYDLQACTNLSVGAWTTHATIFGDGTVNSNTLSVSGQPCAFYRLVEY